ncbi:MAG: hypothetical protein IPK82_27785 [Polyangiaceae bacterium]|nr:hypothetical protein [Polyangiaceae bacterium]
MVRNKKFSFDSVRWIKVPAGLYQLGWRYTDLLPAGAAQPEAVDSWVRRRFSPERDVHLPEFEIARDAVAVSALAGDSYDLECTTLSELCDLLDALLSKHGCRVPAEDELEAAAGGSLFWWGNKLPDGAPYRAETSFFAHRFPNSRGIQFLGDPYKVEVVRTTLKFGDGGTAICGGEPWPAAWLTLSNPHRWGDAEIVDCFPETVEAAYVRPVKLASDAT